MKKYEILKNDSKIVNGVKVYKIKRLKDGLIGGFIQDESNLSHKGDCFIYDNAVVCNKAKVLEDAQLYDNAVVYDKARIYGKAILSEYAEVFDNARVFDQATVFEHAVVYGNSKVYGDSFVYSRANIYGKAKVYDKAFVGGDSHVFENGIICGTAHIRGSTKIFKNLKINTKYCTQNITGLRWPITLTTSYVDIGCETILIKDWSSEKALELGKVHKIKDWEVDNIIQVVNSSLLSIKAYMKNKE